MESVCSRARKHHPRRGCRSYIPVVLGFSPSSIDLAGSSSTIRQQGYSLGTAGWPCLNKRMTHAQLEILCLSSTYLTYMPHSAFSTLDTILGYRHLHGWLPVLYNTNVFWIIAGSSTLGMGRTQMLLLKSRACANICLLQRYFSVLRNPFTLNPQISSTAP